MADRPVPRRSVKYGGIKIEPELERTGPTEVVDVQREPLECVAAPAPPE